MTCGHQPLGVTKSKRTQFCARIAEAEWYSRGDKGLFFPGAFCERAEQMKKQTHGLTSPISHIRGFKIHFKRYLRRGEPDCYFYRIRKKIFIPMVCYRSGAQAQNMAYLLRRALKLETVVVWFEEGAA